MARPKTIQIFLPDGNPQSLRIADITSRMVHAIQVPRTRIKQVEQRDEVSRVGVYFLIAPSEEGTKPIVYVGESEDCLSRIKQHNVSKDFWTTAVIVTSKTHSFTRAHARYLEWYCANRIKEASLFRLENSAELKQPHLQEHAIADLLDTFDSIATLVSTLGFPFFGQADDDQLTDLRVYTCEGRGAKAKGKYTDNGFLVLKGSTAAGDVVDSLKGRSGNALRNRLIESGTLTPHEDHLVFTEDHLFASPSGAAMTVIGRTTNGWTKWVDSEGRSLDSVVRQS